MPTFDTSPLTPSDKRESSGVFAPGPLAGLAPAPRTLNSPAYAFVEQLERIAACSKKLGAERELAQHDFFLLITMIATIHLRSGHRPLVESIRTAYAALETREGAERVAGAITNLLTQRH